MVIALMTVMLYDPTGCRLLTTLQYVSIPIAYHVSRVLLINPIDHKVFWIMEGFIFEYIKYVSIREPSDICSVPEALKFCNSISPLWTIQCLHFSIK